MTKRIPPYSCEVRERAVRMILDHQGAHASQWPAISSVTAKIGCSGETLRDSIWQSERDKGVRAGPRLEARVIDAFACRIVGWRVSRTAHAAFVLDTLE